MSLVLSPTTALPGANVTASGTADRRAGTSCRLLAEGVVLRSFTVSNNGKFSVVFPAPTGANRTVSVALQQLGGNAMWATTATASLAILSTAPPPPTYPTVPLSLSGVPGNTTVALSWSAPSSNGGSAVTGYRVYRNGALIASPSATTYTAAGLTNGTSYQFKVSAVNAVGEGPQTAAVTVVPVGGDTTAPVISNIATGSITQTSVTISWALNEGGTGQVEYGTVASGAYAATTTLVTQYLLSHTQVISGLLAGTPYHFRVKSADVAGNMATSSEQTFTTAAFSSSDVALGRPVVVSSTYSAGYIASYAVDGISTTRWATAHSDPQWIYVDLGSSLAISRVVLYWEAGSAARSYTIDISNDAVSWTTIYSTTTGDGGVDDLTVSGTGRYVRMYGTVRATAYGYSLWAFEVYGVGSGASRPAAPTGLTLTPAVSAITANWTAPSDGGSPITGYKLYRTGASSATTTLGVVLTYQTMGLTSGQTYSFQVAAINAIGEGPKSTLVSGSPSASEPSADDARLPYDPASPWNAPVGAAATHASSATYMNAISDNNLALTSDPDQYAIPLFLYNSSTPLKTVVLSGYYSTYDAGDSSRVGHGYGSTQQIPVPAGATQSPGSDGQILFWDPTTDTEYSFWQFASDGSGGYVATNGYRYHTGAGYYGRFADGLAGRGAGTPYFAGLVRPWEIAQGHIDHALAFAYHAPAGTFVYPASKSDGANFGGVGGVDIPEGGRIVLSAGYDTSALSAPAQIIAQAMKTYGAYVIDNSGSSKIYLEDRLTAGWGAEITRTMLSTIPWSAFRVVVPPAAP